MRTESQTTDQQWVTPPEVLGGEVAFRERRQLSEIERWLEAHLEGSLTLGDLCRVAGVSRRTLHRLFVRYRGQSPMKHVAARRLARARRRLLESHPDDSVTRVAIECGFPHLSRFAGLYRATYGERPSESLRRGAGPALGWTPAATRI